MTSRNQGRGFGLPQPSNFRNGLVVPISPSSDCSKLSDEYVPSAPPSPFAEEIIQEQFQHSKINHVPTRVDSHDSALKDHNLKQSKRNVCGENSASSGSVPARFPTYYASSLGPSHSMIAHDGCVRVCLHAWAKRCSEAIMFLENDCALLRSTFGLQQVLLQSVEEVRVNHSSDIPSEGAATKPKEMIGKMKVQVRKVRMNLDPSAGCNILSMKVKPPKKIKLETVKRHLFNAQSKVTSALRRIPFTPRVSGSTSSTNQEKYSCLLRLKSSDIMDTVRMRPGSGETHIFLPDSLGDDLILEVNDSKGDHFGRVLVQVAAISEHPNDKLRWWPIYREPDHELVGKIQLYINYTSLDNSLKCGSFTAYDIVLEAAMKAQNFQERNLLLHSQWQWLLNEFASYFGVSDAYIKLRYISYIMDVATPTADCVSLVYDLLLPVMMKGQSMSSLSHQENRIFGKIIEQIEDILALVFENYKSLNEQSPSGIMDAFTPAAEVAVTPPVLEPAVNLYKLVHDILSPDTQNKLLRYFQAAVKKRCRRHLAETDKYVSGSVMDVPTAYQKMKYLCINIKNEISKDIEIQNSNIFPSFIDLPNISTAIYSEELACRIREFLVACPPTEPSYHVKELIIATADFQNDIASWNINPIKNGVDAKELFHLYIMTWIQDKRLFLLEKCKMDKAKWSGVRTQQSTTPFVDDMYDDLKEFLDDYEVIVSRWPKYTLDLENAIVDIEKEVIEALDKQYADVITPLKPNKFGLKCFQKLTKRTTNPYMVPPELGILLNSMKRMRDVLRPKIELQLKSCWVSDGGNVEPGEGLSEVTGMFKSKFRSYIEAVAEKLLENTRLEKSTKLKKILRDSKEIRCKMQPLTQQLIDTMNHLHAIFDTHVFIETCREYWDQIGLDVLSIHGNRKENRVLRCLGNRKESPLWYKGLRDAVSILDDIFRSQMQQLLGNTHQEKDLEPPPSIVQVQSIL